MKKMSKVFLGIGALTMLASGALAIGLAANPKEAVKANAATGSVKVCLNDWSSSGNVKIGLYFFVPDSVNEWEEDLVLANEGDEFVDIPYEISIAATHMIAVRFPSTQTTPNWDDKYNQTNNLEISDFINITGWDDSAISGYPVVKGAASGQSWSDIQTLSSTKINGAKNCEFYSQVSLTDGVSFQIVYNGVYYGNFEEGDGVTAGTFTGTQGQGMGTEITVHETGKYSFYFDSSLKKVHISNPVIAAANDWGLYFRNHAECDATGATIPEGWADVASEYAKLDGDVKDYIWDLTAVKNGTYIEDALWNYDWAIAHHTGLDHFITDSTGTHARSVPFTGSLSSSVLGNVNNTAVIATVVIVSLVAVTTIGGIIILKRKER